MHACDLSADCLAPGLDPAIRFVQASAYALPYADDCFELVVCCEVLEHLERPERALAELSRVAGRAVLVSTPWEPLWRMLNVLRGRYLSDLGNTPGHIQHFGRAELKGLVAHQLTIVECRRPLPWTVLLAAPRGGQGPAVGATLTHTSDSTLRSPGGRVLRSDELSGAATFS